jgi:hypothetical protein
MLATLQQMAVGPEACLVVLYGEDGDEETRALMTEAERLEIPVRDLTAGLDPMMELREQGTDVQEIAKHAEHHRGRGPRRDRLAGGLRSRTTGGSRRSEDSVKLKAVRANSGDLRADDMDALVALVKAAGGEWSVYGHDAGGEGFSFGLPTLTMTAR